MHPYLTDMPPEHIFGYLVAAVTALSTAIVWLHRNQMARSDRDKTELKSDFDKHKEETKATIKTLDDRLFETLQKKQDAELRAVKFEFASKLPCTIAECPRRSQSFSVGEKVDSPI